MHVAWGVQSGYASTPGLRVSGEAVGKVRGSVFSFSPCGRPSSLLLPYSAQCRHLWVGKEARLSLLHAQGRRGPGPSNTSVYPRGQLDRCERNGVCFPHTSSSFSSLCLSLKVARGAPKSLIKIGCLPFPGFSQS
jgi:hypothetical protein